MTALHSNRLMFAVLPEYPSLGETLAYQLSGLMVVFLVLGTIWGLLELTGAFFKRAPRAAKPTEAKPVVVAPEPVASVEMHEELTPLSAALITATVHAASQGRARVLSIGPEDPSAVHAIIAAAVHCVYEGRARVVEVNPVQTDTLWAREGRRDIFISRRIR